MSFLVKKKEKKKRFSSSCKFISLCALLFVLFKPTLTYKWTVYKENQERKLAAYSELIPTSLGMALFVSTSLLSTLWGRFACAWSIESASLYVIKPNPLDLETKIIFHRNIIYAKKNNYKQICTVNKLHSLPSLKTLFRVLPKKKKKKCLLPCTVPNELGKLHQNVIIWQEFCQSGTNH